jgi:hypothetical protein
VKLGALPLNDCDANRAFNLTNSVLFPGPDANPTDGPPVKTTTRGYTGYGTISQTE